MVGKPSNKQKTVKFGKSSKLGGWRLPVGREFPTFLTGKTVIHGKYPKHPETSRKAIKKFFENFDLLKVPKFPRGGGGLGGLELFPSLTVLFF